MIDFIRDDADALGVAIFYDGFEFRTRNHRARGVGRAGDDEPLDGLVQRPQQFDGRLETGLGTGRQADHLQSERGKGVAVGGIARLGHGDALAGIEGGEKSQYKPAGRPDGDGDLIGCNDSAVIIGVMLGDAGAQLGIALRLGIAETGAIERRMGGGNDLGRGAAHRFAGFHMHDLGAAIRHLVGGLENFHGVERRHIGAFGDFHAIAPATGCRRWRGHSRAGQIRTGRSLGCAARLPGSERR